MRNLITHISMRITQSRARRLSGGKFPTRSQNDPDCARRRVSPPLNHTEEMLSQTSEHAIRAILYLAQQPKETRVPAEAIARALEAPANYLAKTLNVLAKQGILGSARGPAGGYWLEEGAEEIALGSIIRFFDGPQRRVCILGDQPCNDVEPCELHFRWRSIASDEVALETTTIGEFLGAERLHGGNGCPPHPSQPRDPPAESGEDEAAEPLHATA
jgi:Rrf2 family transcriptional regulator, iron-sulfur cluster assembly transcription factor